ncbi:MAG: hypothetical protein PUA56_00255 [Bacillales bacterium]|nr:hypothetical protein [Bacillales bacterium]
MRRFYGFIVFITSLLLIVFACLQTQVRDVVSGLEYSGGYETLYQVDLKTSDKSINDIADIVINRINDAGVENAHVYHQTGLNEKEDTDYIRITMNAENEQELDYVLRSVEATGSISVSTLMSSGDYDYVIDNPFDIGSAKVEWNGDSPFVKVDIKKGTEKDFKTFTETCNKAYDEFQSIYNSNSEEESTIQGVMIIWLDKTDEDNYINIFKEPNEITQAQMKKKILAIVPTDNFTYTEKADGTVDVSELMISYYDYEQTSMVASSAHTIERIINYGSADYEMTRLYTQMVKATAGTDYARFILIGVGVAAICLLAYFIVIHRLSGLAAWTGIIVSLLVELVVFNFFKFTFTTMSALGILISLVANAVYAITYLNKFKDELYKGKSAVKARQESTKSTLVNLIDVSVVGLFIAIIALYSVTSQVKLLPISVIIGLGSALVLNRVITLFAMYWLTNNKLAVENKTIFGVKASDVPNVLAQEGQKKFNPLYNFDPIKNGKKATIGLGAISLVGALILIVSAIIPGVSIFNESNESRSYTRIEVSSELVDTRYLFETNEDVEKYFNEKYPDYDITNIDIVIEENVIIPGRLKEDMPDIAYVSISLKQDLDTSVFQDLATNLTVDLKTKDYGDTAVVSVTRLEANSTAYLMKSAVAVVSLFAGLAVVFITLRFGYTYGLSTLASLVPSTLFTLGFFSATRLEISALSLTGIAAGLLIVVIAQIPLFENMKKLKRESKVKVTTFEQRRDIALQASHNTMITVVEILCFATLSTLIVALSSPLTYSILSTYGAMIISIIGGLCSTLLILVPVYLFLEKRIHFTIKINREKRNKKRMEKAKEENKNRGAEPQESIIPGIND